jgi:outer membrane protein OmpA-like peptidoglycan-associated protein
MARGSAMTSISSLFRIALTIVAAWFCGTAHAWADCTDLLQRFNAAISARDQGTAKGLETQIASDAACGGRLVEVQRARAGLALTLAQAKSGRDMERLLIEAEEPEVLWQASKALGDLRFSQHRFVESVAIYDRAIEIIKNRGKTSRSPDAAMIKAIFDGATQSRLLAANEENRTGQVIYVPSAKDHRDGSVGGSMSASIRDFIPAKIPIPIRFETASATLSPVGAEAARELLEAIQQQRPDKVTIIGHTDERGGEVFNLKLSDDRAKAVKRFLESNGVQAKIATVAKGKGEPLKLSKLADFTQQEIWALNRRVEWQRD